MYILSTDTHTHTFANFDAAKIFPLSKTDTHTQSLEGGWLRWNQLILQRSELKSWLWKKESLISKVIVDCFLDNWILLQLPYSHCVYQPHPIHFSPPLSWLVEAISNDCWLAGPSISTKSLLLPSPSVATNQRWMDQSHQGHGRAQCNDHPLFPPPPSQRKRRLDFKGYKLLGSPARQLPKLLIFHYWAVVWWQVVKEP